MLLAFDFADALVASSFATHNVEGLEKLESAHGCNSYAIHPGHDA